MTEQEYKAFLEQLRSMEQLVIDRYPAYAKANNLYPDCDPVGFDEDSISLEGDEYWAYGGYEKHHTTMPVSVLFMSDEAFEDYIDIQKAVQKRLKEKEKSASIKDRISGYEKQIESLTHTVEQLKKEQT